MGIRAPMGGVLRRLAGRMQNLPVQGGAPMQRALPQDVMPDTGIPFANNAPVPMPKPSPAPVQPQQQMPTVSGQYGLAGQEQALTAGLTGGLNILSEANRDLQSQLQQGFEQGQQALQPYGQGGGQAAQLQAQLAGAQGAPQQQAAMNQVLNSPEFDFIRDQGLRAVRANAAATGGLGGGEVMRDLTRFGQGLASQQLGTAFDRLGQVSNRGLAANQQLANMAMNRGQLGAQMTGNLAGQGAQMTGNIGSQIGSARGRAGEMLAGQQQANAAAMANLQNQLGQQTGQQIGGFTSNLANMLGGLGQSEAQQQMQLATLLGNLATGQGTQLANFQNQIGAARAAGITGAQSAANQMLGTGLNAGMTAYGLGMFSDRRLKKDIEKKGELFGLNWYGWTWVFGGSGEGFMADEVKEKHPQHVSRGTDGYDRVNYGGIFSEYATI